MQQWLFPDTDRFRLFNLDIGDQIEKKKLVFRGFKLYLLTLQQDEIDKKIREEEEAERRRIEEEQRAQELLKQQKKDAKKQKKKKKALAALGRFSELCTFLSSTQ